ncbi:MAG: mannonate dehydratase [Candidatus Bathyarchaeota archaeon]|jgi:mannonate dehydratase|nr:mannonate dehydratase [Candidatus Bathyarchaeota archaeon]
MKRKETTSTTAKKTSNSQSDISSERPPERVQMKVGSQQGGITLKNLEFWARHGVFHVDGGAPKTIPGVGWDLEDSLAKKEACEKYGINLEAYHLPLSSYGLSGERGIETDPFRHIMLGKSPERDREIEMLQQMIRVAGESGVHLCTYNTVILPIERTGKTKDQLRGNASYNTWNYEKARRRDCTKTIAGDVSIDEIYDRITYLLDRLLPVAEAYGVKLGNHIADPPTPIGYRGITRWNSPDVFEGIKHFAQLYNSKSHGFLFCVGSISEGLSDPKTEIRPIIKWVGERNQIFSVHLRNIQGGFGRFMEVYPDNGDLDFLQVIRSLRDVGYSGMVMPDHVPFHEDSSSRLQAYAFAFGYIKALIHTANQES